MVAALPDGYATPVGHVLDGGQGLSGGQRPRLAVSRTWMRDARMLTRDEPTAALDQRAEAEIYARFTELLAGRASLLISHRLGSARLCDRILVLKEGRIVEDGCHDDPPAAGGRSPGCGRCRASDTGRWVLSVSSPARPTVPAPWRSGVWASPGCRLRHRRRPPCQAGAGGHPLAPPVIACALCAGAGLLRPRPSGTMRSKENAWR